MPRRDLGNRIVRRPGGIDSVNLGQLALQRNARHQKTLVELLVGGVAARLVVVVALDVDHCAGTGLAGRALQCDQARLQRSGAGFLTGFAEDVGLFAGGDVVVDDVHMAGGLIACELELHAAIELAVFGGHGSRACNERLTTVSAAKLMLGTQASASRVRARTSVFMRETTLVTTERGPLTAAKSGAGNPWMTHRRIRISKVRR